MCNSEALDVKKPILGYLGGSLMLSPVLLFERQREIVIQTQKRENKVKQRELTATQSIPKVLRIWKKPQGDFVFIYYRGRCSQGTSGLYTPDREWRIHLCVSSHLVFCNSFQHPMPRIPQEPVYKVICT